MNNNLDSLSQRTDSQVRTLTETIKTNQNQCESNRKTLRNDVASLHNQMSERQDLLENNLDSTRSEIRVVKNTVDKLQKVNQRVEMHERRVSDIEGIKSTIDKLEGCVWKS
jgi:hypothetical protein